MFTLGLIVNPLAGIGGPAALKGSDGEAAAEAFRNGAGLRAPERAARALEVIFHTLGGDAVSVLTLSLIHI